MYKRILCAVNEYLVSEVSGRYALNLAKACNAKLYFCFIAEKSMPRQSIVRAEDAVKRLFLAAIEHGVQVEGISETGDPFEEIRKVVRHEKINLVFTAAKTADAKSKPPAGAVARNLMLKLPSSVALVRVVHMGKVHPKNILVPLKAKINHLGERAYFCAKMAEAFGSRLFVLHFAQPMSRFFHGETKLTLVQKEKILFGDMAEFIEHLKRYGIEYESTISEAAAGQGINIEAASKKHDLIIMGATGRGMIASLLKGNPVENVLWMTPCDLIILKSGT